MYLFAGAFSLALLSGCGGGSGSSSRDDQGDSAKPYVPAPAVLPSGTVASAAPGGGGRNIYVGVSGTCPPAGYPALNGGACVASLDAVPWGEDAGSLARLGAGDTVYISRDASPYKMKFNVSGQGTADQWIRVLGMLGPNGERPIINGIGARTARHSRYRATVAPWLRLQQGQGVIHISAARDDAEAPRYIEVANLDIYGARIENTFVASDGKSYPYGGGRYAGTAQQPVGAVVTVSARDVLIRNNILHDSAEGFYNWTGGGALGDPDGGAAGRHVLRGNVFFNCGVAGNERRHASYTEVVGGIIYEFNYFGPMIKGAMGNQLRDRSGGTVVRYNWIEAPRGGAYNIDLMEPEESAPLIVGDALYAKDFVYGNVLLNRRAQSGNIDHAFIHWSENNGVTDAVRYPLYAGHIGRSDVPTGRLYFYHNTLLVESNYLSDYHTPMLLNWAEQSECPAASRPAVNDLRNNLVVLLPETTGGGAPPFYWERCGDANLNVGANSLTTNPAAQWWEPTAAGDRTGGFAFDAITGGATLDGSGDPFVDQRAGNLRLTSDALATLGVGRALAPAVNVNDWGEEFTPDAQIVAATKGGVTVEARSESGDGAHLGAIED
jgi:hypothetical protein